MPGSNIGNYLRSVVSLYFSWFYIYDIIWLQVKIRRIKNRLIGKIQSFKFFGIIFFSYYKNIICSSLFRQYLPNWPGHLR